MKILLSALLLCLSINCHAVEKDKAMHFGASFAVTTITYSLTESHYKAAAACLIAGLGKELYDEYKYGGFDVKDLGADLLGYAAGAAFSEYAIKPVITSDYVGLKWNLKFK